MRHTKKKRSAATTCGIVLIVISIFFYLMPLVYMLLMSLTQSDSPYFKLQDISFDFANYETILVRNSY